VRATLHDELMREVGFETDYHRDLALRRERRRQTLRRDLLLALSVVAFVGALAAFVEWIIEVSGNRAHVPQALLGAAVAAGFVGGAANWLAGRMAPDEEQHRRSIFLRILPVPWTLVDRVRERITRRREVEA
jgi:hypothetical protein